MGGRSDNPDKAMLWAAYCLGFFCFLQVGEMTVPNDHALDPAVHLTKRYHSGQPDRFRSVSSVSCPGISSSEGGPLFMYQDGQYLTRQRLVAEVRDQWRI